MDSERSHTARLTDPIESLANSWGWLFAFGVLLVLTGLMALGASIFTTFATVAFLGGLLIFGGILDVVSAFTARRHGGFALNLITGILVTIVGFVLLSNPVAAARAITLILGLMLLTNGTARLIYAVAERFAGWFWSLLSGALEILLAVLIFARYPTSALWFIGLAVGVELLSRGVMWIGTAVELRQLGHRRRTSPPPTGMPHAQPGTA